MLFRSLISGQSVTIASGLQVIVQSGVILMSGYINATWLSGLYVASGVAVAVPTSGLNINNSGNPLQLTDASGGAILWSALVYSVTLKCLTSNVGDIYVGGHLAGQMPYSGQGFVLSPGEIITLDVPQIGFIRACAALSGDWVTYIGD